MKIAVFGASGPTGRQVVRQALIAGHHVVAATRNPDRFGLSAPALQVRRADLADSAAVSDVIAGVDAVVSTFGVPYSREVITVYSDGIAAILGGMAEHGVSRLVCVSSSTVVGEGAPGESLLRRSVLVPLLRHRLGRTLYDDMARMEALVSGSGVDWTVVRPGQLFDAVEPTSDHLVSTGRVADPYTSRADLAQLLVEEATGEGHPHDYLEIGTRSGTPNFLLAFLREAFGIG